MTKVNCKSLKTTKDDAYSSVGRARIDTNGVEICPSVYTVRIRLQELKDLVAEIEALKPNDWVTRALRPSHEKPGV